MVGLYFLAAVLVVLALLLFRQSARQRRETGLPQGRVAYSDTGVWQRVEIPLYDPKYRLTGKPDYVVRQGEDYIPVEVKSAWASSAPYEGHVFQLAAYCRLVEQTYHRRPAYGILKYRNRSFEIDYTPELEAALLETLAEMQQAERRGEPDRSHEEPGRCARCGYRSICNQRL
jgi:CRISPR-associated exonuclease Cas4